MAKQFNPQTAAQKWAQKLGQAQQSYTDGINRMDETPGQAANRQKDAYLQGVQQAVASGSFEAGNNSYTLQYYKTQAIQKGAARLASGAQASVGRMQTFFQNLAPVLSEVQSTLQQNPRGSYEQNMALKSK
ncbi:MAG: hypothetical protein ACYC3I_22660 [Gemmataceae bacterium]